MIYDCFMFYNQFDLLEIRMEELWDIVDKFVVVEATSTSTGKDKRMYYQENKDRFEKYQSKIIYYEITDLPRTGSPFYIERVNRDYFRDKLDFQDDDTFFLADVDEIPKASTMRECNFTEIVKEPGILKLSQSLHNYYVNYVAVGRRWKGPLVASGAMLRTMSVSALRGRLIRGSRRHLHIEDGGWHFSLMGGIDKIIEKIQSYPHQVLNDSAYFSAENLLERIRTGKGLFDVDEYKFEVNNDMELPKYLMKNKEKFSHLFYKGEINE